MRRAHTLKPNKSTELPRQAVWLDTETRQLESSPGCVSHHLWFGWATYQRQTRSGKWTKPRWYRFEKALDLWVWIESLTRAKTRLYLYAHNWSFDGPVLGVFKTLPERGWKLGHVVLDGPPFILTWRRGDRTIELIDTLNYWRTSLDSLGESVGVVKLPFPGYEASEGEWDTYCRRDVEVIRTALHSWWHFLKSRDLGGAARTLAGQALRSFRHRFMRHEIVIDEDTRGLEIARGSYHGGRTEAFFLGRVRGRVTALDINSMYPSVMRDNEFPTKSVGRYRNPTRGELERWSTRYCLCAEVTLTARRPRYAVQTRDGLVFPVGRFREWLTTPDLAAALESGELAECSEVVLYERAPIFAEFVDTLYRERLRAKELGDPVQAYLLKILMNSLYGKFGQRGEVWEKIGTAPVDQVGVWLEYDYDSGVTHRLRSFGGLLQESRKLPESYNSHPAIAAHVTAYARTMLWKMIERAGHRNVFYCDTDSLYCSDAGRGNLESLINPSELGMLKVEGETDRLVIYGAKDYQFGDKRVCKGVRAKAEWLSPDTVRQEQWSTMRGLLLQGQVDTPTTRQVVKHLKRDYRKGRVTSSGWIEPLSGESLSL